MFEAASAPFFYRTLGHTVGVIFAEFFYTDHGVVVTTDVPIAEVCTEADGVRITAGDGRVWHVDVAVIGVGADPNVELAAAAGLQVSDGVEVDEHCATSAPHVYAAGDVVNRPEPIFGGRTRVEHWQNAQQMGIAAARAMLGRNEVFADAPWFWSDQFGLNIQVAGFPQRADRVITRGSLASDTFTAYYLHGTALVGGARGQCDERCASGSPTDRRTGHRQHRSSRRWNRATQRCCGGRRVLHELTVS